MDEKIGDRHVKVRCELGELVPGRTLVLATCTGRCSAPPVRLVLRLNDDDTGLQIEQLIEAGPPLQVSTPCSGRAPSTPLAAAKDEHVRTEFPKLRRIPFANEPQHGAPANSGNGALAGWRLGGRLPAVGGRHHAQAQSRWVRPATFWVRSHLAVPGGSISKPLIIGLLALLASRYFGGKRRGCSQPTSGRTPRIQRNRKPMPRRTPVASTDWVASSAPGGLGDSVDSWINTGAVSAGQAFNALPSEMVDELASVPHFSRDQVIGELVRMLPNAVDRPTPKWPTPHSGGTARFGLKHDWRKRDRGFPLSRRLHVKRQRCQQGR